MDPRQQELRQRLTALGFDDVRFASLANPGGGPLRAWLDAGMQADMHWMERSLDKRLDPTLVLPGAKSIVMLCVNYWSGARVDPPAGRPTWARYAVHEDYHDTMKPALIAAGRALEALYGLGERDYRYYVDTGPVLERGWADRAGLGFIGKNAMLISRRFGNWLFLAAILTKLELEPDPDVLGRAPRSVPTGNARDDRNGMPTSGRPTGVAHVENAAAGLLCGKCTRCLDACPTSAFAAPGVVDARRCISYQTIENKGVVPRELRAGIGHRIYGCDVCLEVCPWNRFAQEGRKLLLVARHDLADLALSEILALTPERFADVFHRTPIKRLKLVGLLRNACIVAGNSGDRSLLPQLVGLATTHVSALVRAHAVWAVRQLGGEALLEDLRAKESDPVVRAEL